MILKSSDRNKRVKSTRPKNAHEEVEIKRFAGKTIAYAMKKTYYSKFHGLTIICQSACPHGS